MNSRMGSVGRPAAGDAPGVRVGADGRVSRRERALVTLCVLAVLALGLWGAASAGRARGEAAGVVEVPGGLLRIERVADYDPAALHAKMQGDKGYQAVMPGMPPFMDPDPVADGKRRFSVRVALTAIEPAGVRVERSSFTVSGDGLAPTAPRSDQLGVSLVPQGASSRGELTFEVPAAARNVLLSFSGGAESIPLDLPEAPPPAPPPTQPGK